MKKRHVLRWLPCVSLFGCSLVTPLGELQGGGDAGSGTMDSGTMTMEGSTIDSPSMDSDAAPACNPNAPFGMPAQIPEVNMPGLASGTPRYSRDELTIYFQGNWPGGAGQNDVFFATRASTSAKFGMPARITGINSTADDWDPCSMPDDLALYFGSNRTGFENIFFATRNTKTDSYFSPVMATALDLPDAANAEPWIVPARHLYMVSTRVGTLGYADIYRADWNGAGYNTPVHVDNVSSSADEHLPVVTADEKTMFLGSNRTGTLGSFDVYIARRANAQAPFDVPTNVTELNTTAKDYVTWVSDDGCRVLLVSTRDDPQHAHIYEAKRGF